MRSYLSHLFWGETWVFRHESQNPEVCLGNWSPVHVHLLPMAPFSAPSLPRLDPDQWAPGRFSQPWAGGFPLAPGCWSLQRISSSALNAWGMSQVLTNGLDAMKRDNRATGISCGGGGEGGGAGGSSWKLNSLMLIINPSLQQALSDDKSPRKTLHSEEWLLSPLVLGYRDVDEYRGLLLIKR